MCIHDYGTLGLVLLSREGNEDRKTGNKSSGLEKTRAPGCAYGQVARSLGCHYGLHQALNSLHIVESRTKEGQTVARLGVPPQSYRMSAKGHAAPLGSAVHGDGHGMRRLVILKGFSPVQG